jgi:EAL domain-containing protein (putative c-di-GMP-specific phosphodiesterase class I)
MTEVGLLLAAWFVVSLVAAPLIGRFLRRADPPTLPRDEWAPPEAEPAPAVVVESLRQEVLARLSDPPAQDGEFAAHFQPIVDLATGRVVGMEALTRFRDGCPPGQRFSQAAAEGCGVDLELATLREAFRQAHRLPPAGFLAVNASPQVLASPVLAALVEEADREVVVELSERDPVDDYPALLAAIERLGLDVRLSIDDAGSGFASLRHILMLRPSFVKLDRTWVEHVDSDPVRLAFVAGIQHVAQSVGAALIAEGIETEAERDALRRLGVEYGQGWLLGYPEPAGLDLAVGRL